jgi:hypothetical protein
MDDDDEYYNSDEYILYEDVRKKTIRVYYKITKINDPTQSYIGEVAMFDIKYDHQYFCNKLYTCNKRQDKSEIIKIMREVGFDKWDISVLECVILDNFKERQLRLKYLRYINNTTLPKKATKLKPETLEQCFIDDGELYYSGCYVEAINYMLRKWVKSFENIYLLDNVERCELPTCDDCNGNNKLPNYLHKSLLEKK